MTEPRQEGFERATQYLKNLADKIDEAKARDDAPGHIAAGDQISAEALDICISQMYAQLTMVKTRAAHGDNHEGARLMFLARAVQLKKLVNTKPDLTLFVINKLVELLVDFLVAVWDGDVDKAYEAFTDDHTPLIPNRKRENASETAG